MSLHCYSVALMMWIAFANCEMRVLNSVHSANGARFISSAVNPATREVVSFTDWLPRENRPAIMYAYDSQLHQRSSSGSRLARQWNVSSLCMWNNSIYYGSWSSTWMTFVAAGRAALVASVEVTPQQVTPVSPCYDGLIAKLHWHSFQPQRAARGWQPTEGVPDELVGGPEMGALALREQYVYLAYRHVGLWRLCMHSWRFDKHWNWHVDSLHAVDSDGLHLLLVNSSNAGALRIQKVCAKSLHVVAQRTHTAVTSFLNPSVFNPTASELYVVTMEGHLLFIDGDQLHLKHTMRVAPAGDVSRGNIHQRNAAALSPDGHYLYFAINASSLMQVDLRKRAVVARLHIAINAVSSSTDGLYVYVAGGSEGGPAGVLSRVSTGVVKGPTVSTAKPPVKYKAHRNASSRPLLTKNDEVAYNKDDSSGAAVIGKCPPSFTNDCSIWSQKSCSNSTDTMLFTLTDDLKSAYVCRYMGDSCQIDYSAKCSY